MNGQEHSKVEQNDIAALLESLCEHPLTDGRVEPSPELAALCREAAKAFSRAGAAGSDGGDIADAGPLTAALAALLSSADAQAARRLADAMLRSAAARLDAQSALAFVAAIEQSPQSAPARLVDEMLAPDIAVRVRSAAPRERAGIANIWSLIAGGSSSARRWRMAGACTVLLMAGMASVYRMQMTPAIESGSRSPMMKALNKPGAIADAPKPAPPQPALAKIQPCEPRGTPTSAVPADQPTPEGPTPAASPAAAECAPAPGRARRGGRIEADRSGPVLGAPDRDMPAAARTAPAVVPLATRPAGSGGPQ